MSKKIKILNARDEVAEDLDNYGYSYQAPKPSYLPVGENILVNHYSFPGHIADFVQIGKDLVLVT